MIINDDSLQALKNLDDNSADLVATDPPYGYSFMGKDWDKAVPSVEIWQECLRVLKPGGWCMVMSAPRSDVQNAMISRLMEAGFRLDFTPIYWTYASGFPKAGNVTRLAMKKLGDAGEVTGTEKVDIGMQGGSMHAGRQTNVVERDIKKPTDPRIKALDGSYTGFQPKPAVEVVIVAMKPLSEKTYVDQALKNGKGITWLDDCRVPTEQGANLDGGRISSTAEGWDRPSKHNAEMIAATKARGKEAVAKAEALGRFPANLLVSDDVLNDGIERKSGGGNKSNRNSKSGFGGGAEYDDIRTPDSGSYSRYFDLDKWAKNNNIGDNYVDVRRTSKSPSGTTKERTADSAQKGSVNEDNRHPSTLPFLIVPKASKSEKNKGLEGMVDRQGTNPSNQRCTVCGLVRSDSRENRQVCTCSEPSFVKAYASTKNHHPTVKPLKLMSYLITLGSRPGDTVLDPFVGSGTTIVAAKQLGRNGIGIEREPEYAAIAQARLDHISIKLPDEPVTQPPVTIDDVIHSKVAIQQQLRMF